MLNSFLTHSHVIKIYAKSIFGVYFNHFLTKDSNASLEIKIWNLKRFLNIFWSILVNLFFGLTILADVMRFEPFWGIIFKNQCVILQGGYIRGFRFLHFKSVMMGEVNTNHLNFSFIRNFPSVSVWSGQGNVGVVLEIAGSGPQSSEGLCGNQISQKT